MTLPATVELVEVGARDGLQAVETVLATADKARLIGRIIADGAKRIEVVSFAHPRLVPQMADAETLLETLGADLDRVSAIGLVMNERGLERALGTGIDEVNFVVPASDGYALANQRATWAELADDACSLIPVAAAAGRRTSVTISVAFGDPYDGAVPAGRVVELAEQAVEAGVDEVALGDTIGVAVPPQVAAMVARLDSVLGGVPLRCHFHDTRRAGLANVYAAVAAGVTVLDTSVGGFGGSPFSPAAGGNVATEDAIVFLGRLGIGTGRDPEAAIATGRWLGQLVGVEPPGAHQHVDPWP